MKSVKYHVDKFTFGFSIESIRNKYADKESFFSDFINAHPAVNKVKLKKVLEKVWEEAYPQVETNEQGAE